MKVTFVLIAAIAAQTVYCGHKGSSVEVGKEVLLERTSPQAVHESERTVTCPHGFQQHGKQCIGSITAKPTVHCPAGFFRSVEDEHVCTKFFEKIFECPHEFIHENVSRHSMSSFNCSVSFHTISCSFRIFAFELVK